MKFFHAILLIALLTATAQPAWGTHIRAADIKIEPVCNAGLRSFKITVIAYLNTQSNTRFGTNSEVQFGDGAVARIPMTNAVVRPDLGLNIAIATFEVTHTYPAYGTYTVTYIERDRSSGILNITNSDDVPYVTSVTHTIDPKFGCNTVPVLSVPPLDRACFGVAFFHTPGAYDIDGDSLSYQLSIPKSNVLSFADYTSPADRRFYANFNAGNETKTSTPVFFIDVISGLLTWDAPGMLGEYNIAFNIIEWRKDSLSGQYQKLSTTIRDMQILVEECDNIRPSLSVPVDICVEAGTLIEELILGMDEDRHPVKIEVFSEILDLPAEKLPAGYAPNPPSFLPSDPPAELRLTWQTSCLHVRQQPYQVVFKITDNPPDGPKLVNFKVWNIRVVAPAPIWQKTELDLVRRYGVLEWNGYPCENADKIQIWRKVDSYVYTPGQCETGLPKFLGYHLIGEVNPGQTSFVDTNSGRGLVVGAKYCYRIMAYFNSPASTPSRVSIEQCIGPIEADAPVITHVSIENTSAAQGKARVSWRSPFNINRVQYPPPYEYEVYRANGFVGDTSLVKAGRVADTTFVDQPIDTKEKIFNYRVVVYARPQHVNELIPVDTSSVASSERLTVIPGLSKLELVWRDSVPWSNVVQTRPYHLIYRGVEETNPATMVLIDSVNVAEYGFNYIDDGREGEPIEEDKQYSYRILTRGTYGNPGIALQENFSQVVTAYPENDLVPCTQTLTANVIKCPDYLKSYNCDQKEFSNTIHWGLKQTGGCRRDIAGYRVYAADSPEDDFELLATVTDTLYLDAGLPSFARCYKVAAVDENGIEGEWSEAACNDNCPYYTLPNVFTPNADGYNDSFHANFDLLVSGELVTEGPIRCPRFVEQVVLRVYNRWGNEVYRFDSGGGHSIAIEWDGKDNEGTDLPAGVYFFNADVMFDVMDPAQQNKEIKGWVHLVR